ncbi:EamA family transporter [Saccharopolyspora sp. MS10]|uniref:EamA family transporter n=1 Tax=Saccharopolyspora sp. MS10 TaxID=3385973 RepID=UPI00399F3982
MRPDTTTGGTLVRGVLPLLTYAVLTAALDVYGGHSLELVSPPALAALSFTMTALFFFGLETHRRSGTGWIGELLPHRRNLIGVNATTAVTWIATFYALDHLEPAVVNVLGLALGPVLTLIGGPLMRRGSAVLASEVVIAIGLCAVLGALVWGSFTGRSALGAVSTSDAVLGVGFACACAVGSTANILYMKRLSDRGCPPNSVLATRFWLTAAVTWCLVGLEDRPQLAAALLPAAVIAVIGVGLPIYVLQIGIRHTEPITTSLLVCASPLFAFLLQLLDGRLRPSAFTLGCICASMALVAAGTLARARADSRRRRAATAEL